MITIRGVHNYAPRHLSMALGLLEKLGSAHPLGGLTGPWFTLANHAEALKVAADPQVLPRSRTPDWANLAALSRKPLEPVKNLCISSPTGIWETM